MKKCIFTLCAMLLAVSTAWSQPVNVFMIDNFNSATGTAADSLLDSNGVWTGLNPGASTLGNYRVIGNYLQEVIPPPSGPYNNSSKVISSVFSISNPADTRSSAQIIWQGSDTVPNNDPILTHPVSFNLGSVNFDTLLATSNFYFKWSVINADTRDWVYTIRAYTTDSSNYFEASLVSNLSGGDLSIPKSAFVPVGNPNWSDVDALSFSASYDGALGGDLAFDNVRLAVPEPSSYLMILGTASVVGCYYYRKRRKVVIS